MRRREFPAAGDVDTGVAAIVRAVIRDYKRREKEIRIGIKDARVLDNFRALNAAIDLAMACVEDDLRPILLDDIVRGRGYLSSKAVTRISKNGYYRRRRKVIADVARAMLLE